MPHAPSWPHVIEVRVQWRDVDGAGHLNNAVYFSYMEQARLEAFLVAKGRDVGARLDAHRDIDMILAHASCDFVAPAFLNEAVLVSVRPSKVGQSSFGLRYELREKATGRMLARGESVQVTFDYATNAKKPIPEDLRAALVAGLEAA